VTVTLVVLGTVETPYWDHNPGSRENVPVPNPLLAPTLTAEEAARVIHDAVERGRRTVFKPAILRALVLLNAIAPRLVAKQLRRALPKRDTGSTG
jgi:short-subunit dehydrogenase